MADEPDTKNWIPRPDPTLLTTQMLEREVKSLREILESSMAGRKSEVNARFDGMDKAIRLLQESDKDHVNAIGSQIACLKELHEEKFAGVQTQFMEREVRGDKTAEQNKAALDAALQAAEKAVGKQNEASGQAIMKSETATDKRIEQLVVLITTSVQGLKDSQDESRERITRIESEDRGSKTTKDDSKAMIAIIVAGITLVISTIALFWRISGH